MATARIGKSKELREEATSGMVDESAGETVKGCTLPFGPDEPVNARHEPKGLSAAPTTSVTLTSERDGFIAGLVGRLAFSDWLLGPPLSERDRVNAQIIRARNELFLPG